MCRARLTADGGLAHLVGDPPDVPEEEGAHALLHEGARGALGLDRHDGVDEGGGVDPAQRVAQVTAPARHGRVGEEELVELALELGREVARGAAQADLLRDLRHHLLHVGLGVLGQRHLGVVHGASLAQRGRASAPASAPDVSSPLSEVIRAACTFKWTEPVVRPGFITSKDPALSCQS